MDPSEWIAVESTVRAAAGRLGRALWLAPELLSCPPAEGSSPCSICSLLTAEATAAGQGKVYGTTRSCWHQIALICASHPSPYRKFLFLICSFTFVTNYFCQPSLCYSPLLFFLLFGVSCIRYEALCLNHTCLCVKDTCIFQSMSWDTKSIPKLLLMLMFNLACISD